MATRRNRVGADLNLGTPSADTFRAQAVPFVGAQRRESQASNFQRLANDLGAFNSALSAFGGNISATFKKREKENEQAARDFLSTRDLDEQTKTEFYNKFGEVPTMSAVYSTAKFNRDLPKLVAAEEDQIKEWDNNGWTVPTGKVAKGPDGEEIPETRPMTEADIDDLLKAENEAILEQYPGPANVVIREKLQALNVQKHKNRMALWKDYRDGQHQSKFEDAVAFSMDGTIRQLKQLYPDQPDKVTEGFIRETMRLATETSVPVTEKELVQKLLPKMLGLYTDDIEKNPESAMAALSFIEGKFGPMKQSLKEHPATNSLAASIESAAVNSLARHRAETLKNQKMQLAREWLARGGNINDVDMGDIEEAGAGERKFTHSSKSMLDALGREQDASILTVNGRVSKTPSPEQITALVIAQRKSGLQSPTLQGILEDNSFTPEELEADPDRLVRSLAVYTALKKYDPMGLDDYFKGNKDEQFLLEGVVALEEITRGTPQALSTHDAAALIFEAQNQGDFPAFKARHSKVHKKIMKDGDLTEPEADAIFKTAHALRFHNPSLTDAELTKHIEEMKASKLGNTPQVNGYPTKAPAGVPKEQFAVTMDTYTEHLAGITGREKGNLKAIPALGGSYWLVDTSRNDAVVTDPATGDMISFSYDQALRFSVEKGQTDLKNRVKRLNKLREMYYTPMATPGAPSREMVEGGKPTPPKPPLSEREKVLRERNFMPMPKQGAPSREGGR